MFSHVMVGTNDPDRSKTFYDAVLATIGVPPGTVDKHPTKTRVFWRTKTGTFGVSTPIDGKEAHHANGGTIGFTMGSPEQAQAWHKAGVANGGASIEDPPGIRQGAAGQMYLAYLRDPDGNKLCGLCRMPG